MPGFLNPWMRGMYGLKFSIFSFTSMATSWHAGISLKCLTHLKTVLKALFTFCSSCSASIVVSGSFIQLSYHFCQSDAVSHMFLNGSKSLFSRPSLSYCWELKITFTVVNTVLRTYLFRTLAVQTIKIRFPKTAIDARVWACICYQKVANTVVFMCLSLLSFWRKEFCEVANKRPRFYTSLLLLHLFLIV